MAGTALLVVAAGLAVEAAVVVAATVVRATEAAMARRCMHLEAARRGCTGTEDEPWSNIRQRGNCALSCSMRRWRSELGTPRPAQT